MYNSYINYISRNMPNAVAEMKGSDKYPDLRARVEFYQIKNGVLVVTEAHNLPNTEQHNDGFYGFHIHAGEECSGNASDPFADAMMHYNPTDQPHPYHTGDLPPLLSNDGYAFSVVLVDKFTVREIIGRTVIIHSKPDDFTTQPSGDSGEKIACGVIKPYTYNRYFGM